MSPKKNIVVGGGDEGLHGVEEREAVLSRDDGSGVGLDVVVDVTATEPSSMEDEAACSVEPPEPRSHPRDPLGSTVLPCCVICTFPASLTSHTGGVPCNTKCCHGIKRGAPAHTTPVTEPNGVLIVASSACVEPCAVPNVRFTPLYFSMLGSPGGTTTMFAPLSISHPSLARTLHALYVPAIHLRKSRQPSLSVLAPRATSPPVSNVRGSAGRASVSFPAGNSPDTLLFPRYHPDRQQHEP
jgi:hypothetical protein